jgi:hypothetical protein
MLSCQPPADRRLLDFKPLGSGGLAAEVIYKSLDSFSCVHGAENIGIPII